MGQVEDLRAVNEALLVLPTEIRPDFLGIAWAKLAELTPGMPQDQRVLRVRRHIEYINRRDLRATHIPLAQDVNAGGPSPSADMELAEALSAMDATDQAILLLILAGYNQGEAAAEVGVSLRTVTRRLAALRQEHR